MDKTIKKEIEKQLRNKSPSEAWRLLIQRYYDDLAGDEKSVILRCCYERGWGYWRTLRELNRQGFYMSQTVFYERKDRAIEEIALRAAYERLICPYCLENERAAQ